MLQPSGTSMQHASLGVTHQYVISSLALFQAQLLKQSGAIKSIFEVSHAYKRGTLHIVQAGLEVPY